MEIAELVYGSRPIDLAQRPRRPSPIDMSSQRVARATRRADADDSPLAEEGTQGAGDCGLGSSERLFEPGRRSDA
jgi:hypothetical protein